MSLVGGALAVTAGAGATGPPGYAAARETVMREGRTVAALVRSGNGEAIVARFSPGLKAAVPRATVDDVLRTTLANAPIGRRLGESVLPAASNRRIYLADHRWGRRTLAIEVTFGRGAEITGIQVRPRTPLPRDPNAGRRLRTRLALPFRGEWWVFWGGASERQNYHVVASDQRHAYDLVGWRAGATHRRSGSQNADYWAWGRPVLAPAGGVVVAAVDGVRDNRPQVEIENPTNPAGNHVVLDLGNGEYALLAHLRRGSVRVKPGQRVRRGETLGRCGNSGNSSEPHLHFHVQDRPMLFGAARGLPISFAGYAADGDRVVRGTPVQGQFLRPLLG